MDAIYESVVFNCLSIQKILKVGLPSVFYISSIRCDVIAYNSAKICLRFKATLDLLT